MWLSGSLRQAAAICALAVVDVPGDGNCLFHALAMQDEVGRCGEELRAELANFLESEAFRQDGFEEVWLEEAEHLRGPAAECWGGAVAISAYSLLRPRRWTTSPIGSGSASGPTARPFALPAAPARASRRR